MDGIIEKWNEEAPRYQEVFLKTENDYNRRLMAFLKKHCGLAEGSRVIDIGCGVGKYGVSFARMRCEVTLIDISPEMLKYAAENMSETGGQWHMICGDWRDVSLDAPEFEQKYDLAISTMSPAVSDLETLAKMSAITEGWCLLTRFSEFSNPLFTAYEKILELPLKPPFADFKADCAEMIQAVRACGFTPRICRQAYNWSDRRTPEESAAHFLGRYFNGKGNPKMMEDAIIAARSMADDSGMLCDAVETTVFWIYWQTNAG